MNIEPIYWGVVPAAGLGLRMNATVPKQYLAINNKFILEITLEQLLACTWINQIVVALHLEDQYWHQLAIANHAQISTVTGGQTRAQSVYQALLALEGKAKDDDWVLVHDAVRPYITLKDLYYLIECTQGHAVGGILGIPVTDTLKKVNDNNEIVATIPRENIWCAQTPQIFRYRILLKALQYALTAKQEITDEAGAVELLGHRPLMVKGRPANIKVTVPGDLCVSV